MSGAMDEFLRRKRISKLQAELRRQEDYKRSLLIKKNSGVELSENENIFLRNVDESIKDLEKEIMYQF